jgi:hypothetical protein
LSLCTKLETIGSSAFSGCSSYAETVNLTASKNTLASIGSSAFRSSKIPSVNLIDCTLLTTIEPSTFYNCPELTNITLTGCTGILSIGEFAFAYCAELTSVILTGCTGIKTIGDSAFYGCSKLPSIDLSPCPIETIGPFAFGGYIDTNHSASATPKCSLLTSITFPATLKTIGAYAFYNSGLTALNLQTCTALTSIGDFAAQNCLALVTVRLPASIATLGDHAFEYCTAMTDIYFAGATPPANAGDYTFSALTAYLLKIHVPSGSGIPATYMSWWDSKASWQLYSSVGL